MPLFQHSGAFNSLNFILNFPVQHRPLVLFPYQLQCEIARVKKVDQNTFLSFTAFPLFTLSPRFLSSFSITASALPVAFSILFFFCLLSSFPPFFLLTPFSPRVALSTTFSTFLATISLLVRFGSSEARGRVVNDLSRLREGEDWRRAERVRELGAVIGEIS